MIEAGTLSRAIHLNATPIDVDTYRVRGGTRSLVLSRFVVDTSRMARSLGAWIFPATSPLKKGFERAASWAMFYRQMSWRP